MRPLFFLMLALSLFSGCNPFQPEGSILPDTFNGPMDPIPSCEGPSLLMQGLNLTASWLPTYGANSYTVSCETDEGILEICSGTEPQCPQKVLGAGKAYRCQLSATNQAGTVACGSPISVTALGTVQDQGSTVDTSSSITLRWSPVLGATKYEVHLKNAHGYSLLGDTLSETYTITNLTPFTDYVFKVRALHPTNEGVETQIARKTDHGVLVVLAAPTLFDNSDSVRLEWTGDEGLPTLILKKSSADTQFSPSGCSVSPCVLTDLLAGETYYFKAISQGIGFTVESAIRSQLVLAKPILSTQAHVGSISVSWTSAGFDASYSLRYGAQSEAKTTLTEVTSPLTLSDLDFQKNYIFQVLATKGDVSKTSIEVTATPLGPTFLNLAAPLLTQSGSLQLAWTRGAGISSLVLKQGTNPSQIDTDTSCTQSPCVLSNLTAGTTYYYKLEGQNILGESFVSSIQSATPMANPSIPSRIQIALGSVRASWSAVPGASSYVLGLGASPTEISFTRQTVTTTEDTITGLTPGEDLYIQVKAINPAGFLLSGTQLFRPIGPVVLEDLTLYGPNQLIYTWQSAVGANQYALSRGLSADSMLVHTSCTASPCLEPGLSAGATYFARVEASNNVGGLMTSALKTGTPLGNPTLSIFGGGSTPTVLWTPTTNGETYTLRYGTQAGSYPILVGQNLTSPVSIASLNVGSTYVFQLEVSNTTGSITLPEVSFFYRAKFSPSQLSIGSLFQVHCSDCSNLTDIHIGGTKAFMLEKTSTTAEALVMPESAGTEMILTFGGTATTLKGLSLQMPAVPSSQQGNKLVVGNSSSTILLGSSTAISADGNTAIFGAAGDSGNIGAAFIFTRQNGTWTQGSKLVGNDSVGYSRQGWSVGMSADGKTAIVGGYTDNSNRGAAWIYSRSGDTWTQQGSKLVGSNTSSTARQGSAVAISADGNTALIGGYGDAGFNGAGWVFIRSGSSWSQQGSKLAGNQSNGSWQGSSVALSADGNTAVLGGPQDGQLTGACWVFQRDGSTWTQDGGKLTAANLQGFAYFGKSVALSADGKRIMIGAPFVQDGPGAWIFKKTNGLWSQHGDKLGGTDAQGNYFLAQSVALSADGKTALIGGPDSAAAPTWIFREINETWSQQGNPLFGTQSVGSPNHGYSLALSADGSTALVGGQADDSNKGAVWVFVSPTP